MRIDQLIDGLRDNPTAAAAKDLTIAADRCHRTYTIDRLESVRSEGADNGWIPYKLAELRWFASGRDVGALFREAADAFSRQGATSLEVVALSGAARYHIVIGKRREADRDIAAIVALREQDLDAATRLRTYLAEAEHLNAGQLLSKTYSLLLAAESLFKVEEDAEALEPLRPQWLHLMTTTLYALGQYDQARLYGREIVSHYGEQLHAAPTIRNLLAGIEIADREFWSSATRQEALGHLGEVDICHPNRSAVLDSLWLKGQLLGERQSLERCLSVTARDGGRYARQRVKCLSALAVQLANENPDGSRGRALDLIGEAEELVAGADSSWSRLVVRRARSEVLWALGRRQEAMAAGIDLLHEVEGLRASQAGSAGRTGVVSAWGEHYQWVAGLVLRESLAGDSGALLGQAFALVETMRSRSLLEALQGLRTEGSRGTTRRLDKVATWSSQLSQINRRIAQRDYSRRSFDELAADRVTVERLIDQEVYSQGPDRGAAVALRLDTPLLKKIEGALESDQAYVSYLFASGETVLRGLGAGCWAILVTPQGSRGLALEGCEEASRRIDFLSTLNVLTQGNEPEQWAGQLGILVEPIRRAVLAPVLELLPPGIGHLVISPHGALHHLPFNLLLLAEEDRPRFEGLRFSYTPSARLFLQRVEERTPLPPASVLALVDPEPLAEGEWSPSEVAITEPCLALKPLRYGRSEGREVKSLLGVGSVLARRQASEQSLMSLDLGRFSILHFAAHAQAVPGKPRRSAVCLAPGSLDQDGLLQPHEIVQLRRVPPLVVLGVCEGANGSLVEGEGIMSLARAFLQAGARSVIASHRPVSDRNASRLVLSFYDQLAKGVSAGEALHRARVEMRSSQAPPDDWATFVLIGDSDLRFSSEK
ncbi:MAG: CHAT domain-containing protein [Acidobacteriota bacterium]